MTRRVAILFPWPTLDSVPSLRALGIVLAEAGWEIDYYVAADDSFVPPTFASECIRVIPLHRWPSPYRSLLRSRAFWRWLPELARRQTAGRYRLIFGVDPWGLCLAAAAAAILRCRYAYLSLELLLSHEIASKADSDLKGMEREAAFGAEFWIIQDPERAAVLTRDLGSRPRTIFLLPNGPLAGPRRGRSRYLRKKLGIGEGETVVLHSGSIAVWAAVHELIVSTYEWPREWVLVVHSRSAPQGPTLAMAEILKSLARRGRVMFSNDPVDSDEYEELIDSADIGVAFYSPNTLSTYTGDNIRHIGLSSGKLAYYFRAGVPVLVSDLATPRRLVQDYVCGQVVEDHSVTRPAIERILRDYEDYRIGALRCYEREFTVEDGARRIAAKIEGFATARRVETGSPATACRLDGAGR